MTLRLLNLAARHWDSFEGWCRPLDPWDLPAHRLLSYIYHWATEAADEESRAKFDRQLTMPPPGEAPEPDSPWSPEQETAAFQGLASALNIKPK